ncbi:MAG: hypothetical protein OEU26_23320, partial [Candidatus Tectomicrobia bacterium]|nr:hypothetical protein [Candidatus Tectomicrobia bacterium]
HPISSVRRRLEIPFDPCDNQALVTVEDRFDFPRLLGLSVAGLLRLVDEIWRHEVYHQDQFLLT